MDYERFVFITGVTKFCHVSLFSELNNLTDITMDARYATMLGYTQEEFETYFADRIELASKQLNIPSTQLLPKIKDWYDGYRFHEDAPGVYNPVSLAEFFSRRFEFNNYWFSTGTPSFLLELIISQKPAIISAGFFLRRQNILECFCLASRFSFEIRKTFFRRTEDKKCVLPEHFWMKSALIFPRGQ